jgi:fibronectin type 3 domain-containing protein
MIQARDRGTSDALRRDFTFTPDGTFVLDVPNGSYNLVVVVGDATTAHDQMGFFAEGVLKANLSTAAGQFLEQSLYGVSVRDGQLTLRFDDLGGVDPNVVINGLDVYPSGPF